MYGMMNGIFGNFGFMSAFGGVFMLLLTIALILFIIWLLKQIKDK